MAGLTITAAGVYNGGGATVDFIEAYDYIAGDIIVTNYVVVNNSKYEAICLYTETGNITVSNCTVSSNKDGITLWSEIAGNITVSSCTINSVRKGINLWTVGIGNITTYNCIINNGYYDGLTLWTQGSGEIIVKNCAVTGSGYGGTLRPDGITLCTEGTADITVTNCIITSYYDDGATMWTDGIGNIAFKNCVVTNNGRGGLISWTEAGDICIANCIFTHNVIPITVWIYGSGSITITHNCLFDNSYNGAENGDYENNIVAMDSSNIIVDPIFISSAAYTGMFPNGYFLSQIAAGQSVNSPCVDTGIGVTGAGALLGTTRTDLVLDY